MRDSIPSILFLALALGLGSAAAASSQTTVSTGPGYANEVYYDFQQGVVRTEPLASWDLAFQVNGFSSAISTNGGSGVTLYSVPGKTVDDWAKPLDTTGMAASWSSWHNSSDTWDQGAFNMDSDYNTGHLGWGDYNMATHVIAGSTMYVIGLPDKSVRKIMIDGLTSGTYNFRYANLDGTGEVVAKVVKSDYPGKNFGYYSIRDGKALDHEPAITDWDMMFGKYNTPVSGMPYTVTGVRTNRGVYVARVVTPTPATVAAPDASAYSDKITGIGYDWKSFNGTAYAVNDSLAYFVKDSTGGMYRVVFTKFEGGSTGNIAFNQTSLAASSVKDEAGSATSMALYPSIVSSGSNVDIVYALDHAVAGARATFTDVAGRTISSIDLDGAAGLHRVPVAAPGVPGLYFVTIQHGAQRVSGRVIVQ